MTDKTKAVSQGNQTQKTLFSGVLVLTLSNIIGKAAGLFFKIPMNYIVGDTGMGYYNAAYTIYTFFYMLSTAGLPVAISILVAGALAEGKRKKSRLVLKTALVLFVLIGLVGSGILFVFAESFSAWIGAEPANMCIAVVAPTLFFVCIASALRGYFQGTGNMTPTAISQMLESVCKMTAGVLGALYATRKGFPMHIVAAYAVLGLTLGTAVSMLYLVIASLYSRDKEILQPTAEPDKEPVFPLLRRMIAIAIPVTVSSAVMSLTNLLDAVLLQRLLRSACGMTQEAATTIYGNYTSLAVPLFNLPPVLVYPIAYTIVPYLSRYRTMGPAGEGTLKKLLEAALRMAVLIGTPCAFGMAVLAKPILNLLYRSASAETAAPLLALLAPSSLLVCILAVTNTILQSVGKAGLPVWSMLAGSVVKLAVTILGIPAWGMKAAPVGTFACYAVVTAMNLFFVVRYTKLHMSQGNGWLRILFSGILCAFCARISYDMLILILPEKPVVLLSIVLAALAYLTFIRFLKILHPEDLMLLPKSEKLSRWLRNAVTDHEKTAETEKEMVVIWEVSHGKKQTGSGQRSQT